MNSALLDDVEDPPKLNMELPEDAEVGMTVETCVTVVGMDEI